MIAAHFLGSGGARFVVAKQIRASGGIWLRFGETGVDDVVQLHVDPGPGALVRALAHVPPFRPAELDGIVLSHKHLDHSGDVNVMIEAMTQGGWKPRGALLAPRDAYEGEPVVFPYAQRFVPTRHVLVAHGGPYRFGEVEVWGSIAHVHGVETYGTHYRYRGTTLSYLPCGRFFEGLIADYASAKPDVLIVNVLRFADAMEVDHLDLAAARRIVAEVRPRVAVLSHFGTKMLEADPVRIAQQMEDELGLRVHAARDGWMLDVETELAASA